MYASLPPAVPARAAASWSSTCRVRRWKLRVSGLCITACAAAGHGVGALESGIADADAGVPGGLARQARGWLCAGPLPPAHHEAPAHPRIRAKPPSSGSRDMRSAPPCPCPMPDARSCWQCGTSVASMSAGFRLLSRTALTLRLPSSVCPGPNCRISGLASLLSRLCADSACVESVAPMLRAGRLTTLWIRSYQSQSRAP